MAVQSSVDGALVALAWWVAATLAVLLLVFFLRRSLRLQSAPSGHAELQYTVALRSALIYVAMAIPPLLLKCTEEEAGEVTLHSWGACTASPYGILPTNLMRVYHWLPFWYAAMVCTCLADAISNAYDCICGALIGVVTLSLMNSLAPGGAGGQKRHHPDTDLGWLPGGYSTPAVLIYSLAFVYGLFFSRISVGTKQYALGYFACFLVAFMNPETSRGFRAVLYDYSMEWNWNGPVVCEAWLMFIAVVLSFCSLGLVPCSRRSCERYTCMGSAAKALDDLAKDTVGCWEWLVTNSCQEPKTFDIDSSFYFVKQLGSRRTAIESLLVKAPWECFGARRKKRLQCLWQLIELLRSLRQVLRVELQQAHLERQGFASCSGEARELLSSYLSSCKDSLTAVVKGCCDGDGLEEACKEAVAIAEQGDGAVVKMLALVEATASPDELAFLDRLRFWPSFVKGLAKDLVKVVDEALASKKVVAEKSVADRHWNTMRNGLSWILALLWSLYIRGYGAGCVTTVSYIFTSSNASGSSFDKNINRMVGVGLGLGIGSVPALLVMQGSTLDGGESNVFIQGLTIYLVVMFIMWALVMYGHLAPGSKYGYACLVWVGFSGTQMLRHVPKYDHARGLFMNIIDNMLACLIIFLVDMIWAYVGGDSTPEQARGAVVKCVEDCASIATAVQDSSAEALTGISISAMQEHIKNARFWDSEIRQEGLVWTSFWEAPYKADLAKMLLNHCDNVSVATFALQSSARRCGSTQRAAEIAAATLGPGLAEGSRRSARSVRAALDGSLDSEGVRELLERPVTEEAREAPSTIDSSSPSERAAELAVRTSAQSLRLALQHIGQLLAARATLDGRNWQTRPAPSTSCNGNSKEKPAHSEGSDASALRQRR